MESQSQQDRILWRDDLGGDDVPILWRRSRQGRKSKQDTGARRRLDPPRRLKENSVVPSKVHLVGSIALNSVDEVFETAGSILGRRLRRIPDGEPGGRRLWISWQYPLLRSLPFLKADTSHPNQTSASCLSSSPKALRQATFVFPSLAMPGKHARLIRTSWPLASAASCRRTFDSRCPCRRHSRSSIHSARPPLCRPSSPPTRQPCSARLTRYAGPSPTRTSASSGISVSRW